MTGQDIILFLFIAVLMAGALIVAVMVSNEILILLREYMATRAAQVSVSAEVESRRGPRDTGPLSQRAPQSEGRAAASGDALETSSTVPQDTSPEE